VTYGSVSLSFNTRDCRGSSLISTTHIVVQNDNDDDAQNVQLIVTLPPTSHIQVAPPTAVPGPSFPDPSTSWRTIGYVTMGLGTLGVGRTTSVTLTTEMLVDHASTSTTIGGFAFSNLPDPIGANNFSSAAVLGH
jgi:hypothetical protein